jgi:hypothetical protein
MSCATAACLKVEVIVERWMESHDAEAQAIGLRNVFDDVSSLDVVISVQLADGKRQLSLKGQQVASVTPVIEDEIMRWLNSLPAQPAVR